LTHTDNVGNKIFSGFIPDDFKIPNGNYNFRFTKDGLLPANKSLSIDGNKNYDIRVNLSNKLPNVTANMIYERYRNEKKTINDFTKRKETEKRPIWLLTVYSVIMIPGGIISSAISEDEVDINFGIGVAITGCLLLLWNYRNIKNSDNIAYNKQIPNFVKADNQEAKLHNENIDRLIKDEQHRRYNKNAIKVYEK